MQDTTFKSNVSGRKIPRSGDDVERQADPGEVEELVAAGAVDHRVGLVADRRREGERRREHHRDDQRPRVEPEAVGERDRHRRHDHRHRVVRQQLGQDLGHEVEHEQHAERRHLRQRRRDRVDHHLRRARAVERLADDQHGEDQHEQRGADRAVGLLRLDRAR